MDKTACSCGGENPRCFRCDGTGLFNSDTQANSFAGGIYKTTTQPGKARSKRSKAISTSVKAAQVSTPVVRSRKYIVCNFCSRSFPEGALFAHSCRKLFTPLLDGQSDTGQPSKSQCPQCGVWVRRLAIHTKKAHPLAATVAGMIPKRMLYQCSHCSAMVKNLKKHTERAHSTWRMHASIVLKNSRASATSQGKSTSKSPRAKGWDVTKRDAPGREPLQHGNTGQGGADDVRNIDATYGWGGSFRDHGQFGSHPSYDSMDDESSA